MDCTGSDRRFSEKYGHLRAMQHASHVSETTPVTEEAVRCLWYDHLFTDRGLCVDDGRALRVVSAGWWNRGEGPDFKGAQIELAGERVTGDVEIHLDHGGWMQHGHHLDDRYDHVALAVTLERTPPPAPPRTSKGRRIPVLLLSRFLEEDIQVLAGRLLMDDYPFRAENTGGKCSELAGQKGMHAVARMLGLAGEWRILTKARTLRERMERAGTEQALYEAFMTACGYGHFKHHFNALARQFHYGRVRQLARQDPLLLEAALLRIAGLFPDDLPEETHAVPHFGRLRGLLREALPGLKPLPLEWTGAGVRPVNNPERRLAGAARVLAHTARAGLLETVETIWREDCTPKSRLSAFEALFPAPMGYWANHCTWTGKTMARPCALIGPERIRSIVGNVFIPAELAIARQANNPAREERVFDFFTAMPKEAENRIGRIMLPRLAGPGASLKMTFRLQQGLLQIYQDWCEKNPACIGCPVAQFL
ncbi:MAG TPA: DUF2851 family protein [Candidatus Hydrogenedentes bacterium]|nr:DUF2851 family protein [Candidatus Hydrogenedentota bacterium]HRT66036.1 DUF2851 family protein [Candidatus Hydrogenedentota bacterium]